MQWCTEQITIIDLGDALYKLLELPELSVNSTSIAFIAQAAEAGNQGLSSYATITFSFWEVQWPTYYTFRHQ